MRRQIAFIIFILLPSVVHSEGTDVSKLSPGEYVNISWRGFPVLVYRRTSQEIEELKNTTIQPVRFSLNTIIYQIAKIYGNEYASELFHGTSQLSNRKTRSIREDFLVAMGLSTNFGCAIQYQLESHEFLDPCSGVKYGIDGRIKNPNKREVYHLLIPPHSYTGEVLLIGEEADILVNQIDFSPNILNMKISDGEKLVEALQWRKYDLARQLLNNSKVLDYETITGANALHFAATGKDPKIILDLIRSGFDVNKMTESGITPLHLALTGNYDVNAIELLKNGAKIVEFCIGKICAKSALEHLISVGKNKNDAERYIKEIKNRAL